MDLQMDLQPTMRRRPLGTKTRNIRWSSENWLKTLEICMAARAYWKGSLKLSLVTCPVQLYPATTAAEKTRFHLINKETGNRLKQQMVDAETGDVVEGDQKARGYELRKGEYIEVEKAELEAVQIESNHTIDIDSFVPKDEINKRYLNHPYYIAPDGKAGVDAFAVIRDAMKDSDRVALARIVLTNREHIIAIEPLGNGLLGTTLRYPYELRDEEDYFDGIRSPKITKDMIELASHILDTKAAHFDPSKFKDEYETALKTLVRRKAAGKPVKAVEREERPSNVINLMDALKQSLKGQGAAKRTSSSARRQASHRRSARKAHRSAARHRKAG
jgi:DNA end-binding protein Ku